jgi:signal peptidase I
MGNSIAITILRRALGVLWVTSLAIVVLLGLTVNVGRIVGLEVFAVRGGSMAPTIPVGAAVIAVPTAPDAIQLGDIVTIRADNGVVFTHRVVEIDTGGADYWLRTKGDRNTTADAAPIPGSAVVGVVRMTIPLAGYLIAMSGTPTGILSVLAYVVALLLAIRLLGEAAGPTDEHRRLAGSADAARA